MRFDPYFVRRNTYKDTEPNVTNNNHLTLKMTSAQVVETSVKVTSNSPSQGYTHQDDHNLLTYDMTPGFKPFSIFRLVFVFVFFLTSIRKIKLYC